LQINVPKLIFFSNIAYSAHSEMINTVCKGMVMALFSNKGFWYTF